MNRQDKPPMVTREVVRPSLENFRRHVEEEEKREEEEARVHPKGVNYKSTWFMGGKL